MSDNTPTTTQIHRSVTERIAYEIEVAAKYTVDEVTGDALRGLAPRVRALEPAVPAAQSATVPGNPAEPREGVGRLVRQLWVAWAREQADPKPSWLLPWEEIDDGQREVDMRIGAFLFEAGQRSMSTQSATVDDAPAGTQPQALDVQRLASALHEADCGWNCYGHGLTQETVDAKYRRMADEVMPIVTEALAAKDALATDLRAQWAAAEERERVVRREVRQARAELADITKTAWEDRECRIKEADQIRAELAELRSAATDAVGLDSDVDLGELVATLSAAKGVLASAADTDATPAELAALRAQRAVVPADAVGQIAARVHDVVCDCHGNRTGITLRPRDLDKIRAGIRPLIESWRPATEPVEATGPAVLPCGHTEAEVQTSIRHELCGVDFATGRPLTEEPTEGGKVDD